jgi:HPt (histidine-containing phosphotransfer) domain-containing protein
MTCVETSNGLTTGASFQEVWSPPLFLLDAMSGEDDLIAELIDAFNTDAAARMQQLRVALRNSDFSRILAEAHAIKGSARQVGADAVADACQELEIASEFQEVSLVAGRVSRVQLLLEDVLRAMAAYSSNRGLHLSGMA